MTDFYNKNVKMNNNIKLLKNTRYIKSFTFPHLVDCFFKGHVVTHFINMIMVQPTSKQL